MDDKTQLFGDYLLEQEVISPEQLEEALALQKNKKNGQIGELLVELNYLKITQLNHYLKQHHQNLLDYQSSLAGIDNLHQDSANSAKEKQQITDTISFGNSRKDLVTKVRSKFYQYKLSTGIVVLDIQHCWFIMILEYILLIITNPNKVINPDDIRIIAQELSHYAAKHFEVEEALIRLVDSGHKHHSSMHSKFSTQQSAFLKSVEQIEQNDTAKLRHLLNKMYDQINEWFLSHIAIHDKTYAIKIKANPNKGKVLRQWVDTLKENNLLEIKINEKSFYDDVTHKPLQEPDSAE